MLRIILPGCGFGFWYIYGIYHQLIDRYPDEIFLMLGKSGGAVVCFLSLLKKEYQQFSFLLHICEEIKAEEDKKCIFNLHRYVKDFCERLIPFLDKNTILKKMPYIHINTTKVSTRFKCIPSRIKTKSWTPKTVEHMIQLICASCYVPILSRTNCNPCCFLLEDECMIDGAFLDLFFDSKENTSSFEKVHSQYSQFTLPSREECIEMYYSGYLNSYPNVLPNRYISRVTTFETIPIVFSHYNQIVSFVKCSLYPIAVSDETGLIFQASRLWPFPKSVKCVKGNSHIFIIKNEKGNHTKLLTKRIFVPCRDVNSIYLLTCYFIHILNDLKYPLHVI